MFVVVLLAWFIFYPANGLLDVYEGREPIASISPIFNVVLQPHYNVSKIFKPHVYYIKVNNTNYDADISHLENAFYNRSVSWIEFGQETNDTTLITVSLNSRYKTLFNINNSHTIRILPLTYNIKPTVNYDKNNNYQIQSVSFNISNNFKSMSVEYGNECNLTLNQSSQCLNSSFKDSLFIFIGDVSPSTVFNPKSNSDTLYFAKGVHNIRYVFFLVSIPNNFTLGIAFQPNI